MEVINYQSYSHEDHLEPGRKLKIKHSIYIEQPNISSLVVKSKDELEAMRQESVNAENKAFDIVVAAAKQWEQQAATTQLLDMALEYFRTPEVKHTGNQWEEDEESYNRKFISNRVYKMSYNIWEKTEYDRDKKELVPVAWYVSWNVYLNSPLLGYSEHIAGQRNKRYTDKNAALKYIEGRKKAYAHLFTEISPVIPKEYEDYFKVYDTLLPGYTVEEK